MSDTGLGNPTYRLGIPEGVYKLHFQLLMADTDGIGAEGEPSRFDIDDILVRVSGTTTFEDLHIDWILADRSNTEEAPTTTRTMAYSGETILEIRNPDNGCPFVGISLILQKDFYSTPLTIWFWDPQSNTLNERGNFNSPARLVLSKLAELPPAV
jgi:hypothetical protein